MKKQSTMGGFAILSAGVIIVKILSLLYIPFLLHIIGGEGYGVYSSAYTIFTLIFAVTTSGLPQAISKIVSELTATGNYKDALKAFKMARFLLLSGGLLMSLILLLFAWPLANLIGFPRAYWAVLALCPTIIFASITSSYRGYFQGRKNMIPTAVSQVLEQLVNTTFTLFLSFILIRHGIPAACAGGSFATTIAAFIAAMFLVYTYKRNREYRITKLHDNTIERFSNRALIKKILNYSIPLTVYQALFYVGNLIDVGNTHSRLVHAGFSDKIAATLIGNLTRFNQLINVPNAIIGSLAVAILPAISASAARNDKKDVKTKINSAFKICFLISIPSAFALSILSSPIYRMIGFGQGSGIMAYGAYILILMSCVQIFSGILQGLGKLYIVTFFLVFGVIGKIVTNYFIISIPQINIMGAIIGNIVYYTLPLVLDNIILIRILKIRINIFKHAVKPIVSSLIMSLVLYISYNALHYIASFVIRGYISVTIPTIISMLLGAYTYFYVMAATKGIRSSDLNMMPTRIRKLLPANIKNKITD